MKKTGVCISVAVIAVFLVYISGCWYPFCPKDESPYVIIDKPPVQTPGIENFGKIIVFGWHSGLDSDPTHIRYMHSMVVDTNGDYNPGFNIIEDLNENPWRYEDKWSGWIRYNAPDDAGRTTVLVGDEELKIYKEYIFAVQAKNRCGKVTDVFERGRNVRRFRVFHVVGPLLKVWEPFLGRFVFLGDQMNPAKRELPPAIPLNFRWKADAGDYGGEIVAYRYGWDVQDIQDPDDWEVSPSPSHLRAPERRLYSGTHTFYIEAVDNAANVTLARIIIEIIPFTMERNLLWVDDFYATDPQSPLYEHPSEGNHDSFWLDICSRAEGFDAQRDVYDCYSDHNLEKPTIQEMGKYKNIIWTYSSAEDCWSEVVKFIPESRIGKYSERKMNCLPVFLASGGHLWTLGRSEKNSGLAAVFPIPPLFPATFKFDIAGESTGDTSWVFCMGHKDYCVTSIDKVRGAFRTGEGMPPRSMYGDALRLAFKDDADWVTAGYPDLPERLDLWEEVAKGGRFFDRTRCGFIYVEVYDPEYYMDYIFISSQQCFHPMYRMKSRNSRSPLNDCTVAIWITKYGDIIPNVAAGPAAAAPSVHFGFPLWFFDRGQVDRIVDVIFDEWRILGTP